MPQTSPATRTGYLSLLLPASSPVESVPALIQKLVTDLVCTPE